MIKLLIGGSPCTHWSIAQRNNRETEPNGIGWELFRNYLIAKEKFKPDFFLYENNKSAAQPIKNQIAKELNVDLMYINSALVSAQNRQRFYAFNWTVEQPEDRNICLQDILESGEDLTQNNKSYALTATYERAVPKNTIERHHRPMVITPIRVGNMPNSDGTVGNGQAVRIYDPHGKSVTLNANAGGGGAKTGLYAIGVGNRNRRESDGNLYRRFETSGKAKANALTSVNTDSMVAVKATQKDAQVYEVKDKHILIKDRRYPINLPDGYYTIRKLTITECCRLQTMPDDYCRSVSKSQAYKCLGNGWTAEVIIHILDGVLKNVPHDEELVVLSMYDGIGTGRFCLDKMGFTNIKYYAYEIDKFAIQVATSNYPDIIECGDAFNVRNAEWSLQV